MGSFVWYDIIILIRYFYIIVERWILKQILNSARVVNRKNEQKQLKTLLLDSVTLIEKHVFSI